MEPLFEDPLDTQQFSHSPGQTDLRSEEVHRNNDLIQPHPDHSSSQTISHQNEPNFVENGPMIDPKDEASPSTNTKKSFEETLFLNYVDDNFIELTENQFFKALDLHQKIEENSDKLATIKFNKILNSDKSNEILFVNYDKPMPTRYSQDMDNIVSKLQESGAELLTGEYLIGITSESDPEEDANIENKPVFSIQGTSNNNTINDTKENIMILNKQNRKTTTQRPCRKIHNNLKGCIKNVAKSRTHNLKKAQNVVSKTSKNSYLICNDTKIPNGHNKNGLQRLKKKHNKNLGVKCLKKPVFDTVNDVDNSVGRKKNRNFENVNNNNYFVRNNDDNEPDKLKKRKIISKKKVQNTTKTPIKSKVTDSNSKVLDPKLEMIQKVKEKLLSENTRMLRRSKNDDGERNNAKKLPLNGNPDKLLKSSRKSKSNDPITKREKYLSEKEIETVKTAFKRLKQKKVARISHFLKRDANNIVEIKKCDIVVPKEIAAKYILPRRVRNVERIGRLRQKIKSTTLVKDTSSNTNVEVVNTCKIPREICLKIISNDEIDKSKRGLEQEKYFEEVVDLESDSIIRKHDKILQKIIPKGNRNCKEPSYSYRKVMNRPKVKRYINRKKQQLIKEELNTELNAAAIKVMKSMEIELNKQTTKESILSETRPLEGKDILAYKKQIAEAMEKMTSQTQLKLEMDVVELDPLYGDQHDVFEHSLRPEVKKKSGGPIIIHHTVLLKNETEVSKIPLHKNTRTSQRLRLSTFPKTENPEYEFIQEVQSENELDDRCSPLCYNPEDDSEVEPRVIPDVPFLSRDPAMLQNDDYDDDADVTFTPLHSSYADNDETLFSLSTGDPVIFQSQPNRVGEILQYSTEMSNEMTDNIQQEESEDSYTLHLMEPARQTSVENEIIQDDAVNPENSPLNKKPKLSAKIIRRAPIYQDAAKADNNDLDSTEAPDDMLLYSDPTMTREDENQDPYTFDEVDTIDDIKIEDNDLLSTLPRVIHNYKKKTFDKHGDKKAKLATVYPCSKCLYIGSNVHNLERHNLTHMDPKDIVWHHCDQCAYKTKYKSALKGHAITHKEENSEKIFSCHLCNYKAHRKQNLNKHIYTCHNIDKEEAVFQCYDCGKQFNSKAKLITHINNVHSISCEKCQFCNFVTPNKSSLASHIKIKHVLPERLYFCPQCQFKAKFPRDLDKHILRMHNRDQMKKYDCVSCPFSTIYKANMRYHMTHVHNSSLDDKTLRQFICGHCMKVCNNKMALKAHIWQRHMKLTEADYFKCEKCKFKTKVIRNLRRHVFLQHEQQGKKCPKCEFTTTRSISMIAHMVAHKKEEKSKIYRCNECIYIAYSVSTMVYHMKKFHNKIVSSAELRNYLT